MSDVSEVVKYFVTVNEGFITSLAGTISSGTGTVPLTEVSGLTDGSVFVGIVEPGQTNQQVFTGTVDVAGSQITGVVWTRGANVSHSGGVTVVDYVTGTAINMITAGIQKEHKESGSHANVNADNVSAPTGSILELTSTDITTNTLTVGGSPINGGVPSGAVTEFAGATIPTGWLLADGSSVVRATYPNLFTAIGTTYGSADGTHFTLPNLKGKTVFGVDGTQTEFSALGTTGGQKTIPAHTHSIAYGGATAVNTGSAIGVKLDGTGSTGSTGTGTNNLNPYITLNYIIKT